MLARDVRSHRESVGAAGPVVFDRGIPDVIGYLRLCGLPVPEAARRAARQRCYARRVFVASLWPAIREDAERKQTLAEAEATCRKMVDVHACLNYESVTIPRGSVSERARFVRERIP